MPTTTSKGQALGTEMPALQRPDEICNIEVVDLTLRIDRMCLELNNCASATRNDTTEADIERMQGMAADIRKNFNAAVEAGELDLPTYHPIKTPLPVAPTLIYVQNVDVMAIISLLRALAVEITNSDASERATGFSEAQAERVTQVLDRIDARITAVSESSEVDAPNSAQQKPGESSS